MENSEGSFHSDDDNQHSPRVEAETGGSATLMQGKEGKKRK
jgi:hypothetical protein